LIFVWKKGRFCISLVGVVHLCFLGLHLIHLRWLGAAVFCVAVWAATMLLMLLILRSALIALYSKLDAVCVVFFI
jgi:hypothetical protein